MNNDNLNSYKQGTAEWLAVERLNNPQGSKFTDVPDHLKKRWDDPTIVKGDIIIDEDGSEWYCEASPNDPPVDIEVIKERIKKYREKRNRENN